MRATVILRVIHLNDNKVIPNEVGRLKNFLELEIKAEFGFGRHGD